MKFRSRHKCFSPVVLPYDIQSIRIQPAFAALHYTDRLLRE